MTPLLCLAVLAATPLDATTSAETTLDNPRWALQLRLTSPSLVAVSGGIGALGIVSRSEIGLGGGLVVERAVAPQWTVQLGLDGSAQRTQSGPQFDSYVAAVSPGVRWYASRALEGGWVGLNLPLSHAWSSMRAESFAIDSRSLLASAELLFGWNFRWDNRLLLSLGLGPTATVSRSWGASNGTAVDFGGFSLGARAALAVGLVF